MAKRGANLAPAPAIESEDASTTSDQTIRCATISIDGTA